MDKTLIFELENDKYITIECLEIGYDAKWSPLGILHMDMDIEINSQYFSDINSVKFDKFKLHTIKCLYNGCCIRSVGYHDDYLKVSLLVDNFIYYQQNPLFIKMNRKLKISDILDTM